MQVYFGVLSLADILIDICERVVTSSFGQLEDTQDFDKVFIFMSWDDSLRSKNLRRDSLSGLRIALLSFKSEALKHADLLCNDGYLKNLSPVRMGFIVLKGLVTCDAGCSSEYLGLESSIEVEKLYALKNITYEEMPPFTKKMIEDNAASRRYELNKDTKIPYRYRCIQRHKEKYSFNARRGMALKESKKLMYFADCNRRNVSRDSNMNWTTSQRERKTAVINPICTSHKVTANNAPPYEPVCRKKTI